MKLISKQAVGIGLVILGCSSAMVATAASKRQENRCDKYVYVLGGITWNDARLAAIQNGGRLVAISSTEEEDCVNAVISDAGQRFAWIGATDSAEEGTWRWDGIPGKKGIFWVGDQNGTARGYESWWEGYEPNNASDEDCAYVDTNAGGIWVDGSCSGHVDGYVYRTP